MLGGVRSEAQVGAELASEVSDWSRLGYGIWAIRVHYGEQFNNAFWTGTEMTYGDGDGELFLDFTLGNDVIAHELTHGITQYSLQLSYTDEAGGLNESMSDIFGAMFRQYQAGQTASEADWLIASDIIGPLARQKGCSCLRDMANPAGAHCLAPQIDHYSQYEPGMEPHVSSGVPNLAFQTAALAIGGNSWERPSQVWYQALTKSGAQPDMTMPEFAATTKVLAQHIFPTDPAVAAGITAGWLAVGL
jgi:Zn-dependent metalloprotease